MLRRLQVHILLRSKVAVLFSKGKVSRPNLPFTMSTSTCSSLFCRDHARSFSSRVATKPTAWNTNFMATLRSALSSKEMISTRRTISARYDHQVTILYDIQGPKTRTVSRRPTVSIGDTRTNHPSRVQGHDLKIWIRTISFFINDGNVKLVVI